jgi:hypothetical protein
VSSKLADLFGAGDDPRLRRHAHTCSNCGHVFVHDPDACIGDSATEQSCAIAHVCPSCGYEERYVDEDASEPDALSALCPIDGSGPDGATCPTTYESNTPISDLDAAGFRYNAGGRDPPMGAGPLDSLLGLLPEAERQAQGLLQGAGQQAGQAVGAAAQAAAPQFAEALKQQLPGLAQAAGQAAAPVVTPIAQQAGETAGQAAGQAAGRAARQELEAEKSQVADVLKVGGMVVGGVAVVGLVAWALWPKRKRGG